MGEVVLLKELVSGGGFVLMSLVLRRGVGTRGWKFQTPIGSKAEGFLICPRLSSNLPCASFLRPAPCSLTAMILLIVSHSGT